jgi:hypothetical protein
VKKLMSLTGVAGVMVAVIAVPAIADHKPGHTPRGGGSAELALSADTPIVRFNPVLVPPGGVATLSGRLKGRENAGQVIVLTQNPAPLADNRFEPTGREATTDAQGNFRFADVVTPVNTQFRAQTASPSKVSNIALVRVRPRVSFRVGDTTPRRGQRVRFRGKIWPEHDGRPVAIQRRGSDGKFRTIKRTVAREVVGKPFSRYGTRVRVRSTGVYRVIIRPGDGDHIRGISRKRTLRVG